MTSLRLFAAVMLLSGSSLAQAVAPPPPAPAAEFAPVGEGQPAASESQPATTVAPPPGAQPAPSVAPPAAATTPAPEVQGAPSDLPYYVPVGPERLPEQKPPVAPPQPEPPEMKIALAPYMRHHVLTNGAGNYGEFGGVIRFGSAAGGVSFMATTVGTFGAAFELPTLVGVPIYEGPVTVAFVPRGYIQYEIYPEGDGGMATNFGALPSFQVAGCQGLPWYFNLGGHLTGHLILPFASGAEPQTAGTGGVALEAGVMFF